jgi:predicted GIY-YIG superfamily endonuclease
VDALVRKTKLAIEKRTKKLALIAEQNPSWRDLAAERCGDELEVF